MNIYLTIVYSFAGIIIVPTTNLYFAHCMLACVMLVSSNQPASGTAPPSWKTVCVLTPTFLLQRSEEFETDAWLLTVNV